MNSFAFAADLAPQEDLSRLRALCVHDLATGAYNRRHFELLAESEWTRALRHRRPLSIVIFEPMIEGAEAHAIPDRTLARIAADVNSTLRGGGDTLARYDARRFAVLLPETDAEGTRLMAARLHRAVSRLASDSSADPVRAVIGAATLRETCAGEKGWRGAMDVAVNALERARRQRDPLVLIEVAAPMVRWPVT
jgi:diguanylate cyclase (GGDEF)-like protein